MTFDEVWKPIAGYEGLYEVSNKGVVKNSLKNKVLKQTKANHGYFVVSLMKNGNCKQLLVHRVVASTFLDNPCGFPCVNHKDEDKTNNSAENLEWCSYRYNNRYNNLVERNTEKKKKKILQFDKEGKLIKEWNSIEEAQKTLKIHNISYCCKGSRLTAGGYKWEMKEGVNDVI